MKKEGKMMEKPYVHEVRTGKVKTLGKEGAQNPLERKWETGMFKKRRDGKVWVYKTGLNKDEIADTKVHGGPEKALFAYPSAHYEYWQKTLDTSEIDIGGMGENLVVTGINEYTSFIGDIYRLGEAIIEVSQPRQPCWKPARRYQVMDLALQIQQTGFTGWYYRVLEEGYVDVGEMELLERPHPEWSIQASNEVMHVDKKNLRRAHDLASCPALAVNWRNRLQKRLRGQESSIHSRVYGPNKER